MSRRFLVLFAACLLFVTSLSASAQPSFFKVTLLSTNDLHAHLWPFDQPENLTGKIPQTKNVGGVARRATYVNKVRSEANWPVLLLDSGDTTFSGSALGKAFRGVVDVDIMNKMGYVAMEPGNHDFQWHSEDTVRNLKASEFPWVCANLVDEKTGKTFLPPYEIREYGGVKIAFFGLITSLVNDVPYLAAHELGLKQIDGIEVAKKLVPELRQKADIIVCLSHMGVWQDPKLANAVPGIDVILGGHSHTRLATPTMVSVGTPTAMSLAAVPVVQAFCWGSEIGRTDLIFHWDVTAQDYTLMSCKGQLISLDGSVSEDPTIGKMLQDWDKKRLALPAAAPAQAPAAPAGK